MLKAGNFQSTEVMGLEVHVKDEARFKSQGNWAFFGFDASSLAYPGVEASAPTMNQPQQGASAPAETRTILTSKMTPTSASCYSCHAQHAAVDTTFVQFYPTLLPVAQSHSTLSPTYTKESAAK